MFPWVWNSHLHLFIHTISTRRQSYHSSPDSQTTNNRSHSGNTCHAVNVFIHTHLLPTILVPGRPRGNCRAVGYSHHPLSGIKYLVRSCSRWDRHFSWILYTFHHYGNYATHHWRWVDVYAQGEYFCRTVHWLSDSGRRGLRGRYAAPFHCYAGSPASKGYANWKCCRHILQFIG